MAKRGTLEPTFILSAADGTRSFEEVHRSSSLKRSSPMDVVEAVTAVLEIPSMLDVITLFTDRVITVNIDSLIESLSIANDTVKPEARTITDLFNTMPILHHRDLGII